MFGQEVFRVRIAVREAFWLSARLIVSISEGRTHFNSW